MTRTITYCIIYAILNVSGATLIKLKLKNTELNTLNDWILFLLTYSVLFAFIFIFLSALVMFKALSTGSLSATIPIATGVNFTLTVLAGYFLFKDRINTQTIIGLTFIISGILIISLNQIEHAK